MRLLGLDPSLSATGMAALDLDARKVVAWKCVRTKVGGQKLKMNDLAERLRLIATETQAFCALHQGMPVIEGQIGSSYGRSNIPTTFKLGAAYGAVLGALPTHPLVLSPAAIKKRVTGDAGASKAEAWKAASAFFDRLPPLPKGKVAQEAVQDAVVAAVAGRRELEQHRQMFPKGT